MTQTVELARVNIVIQEQIRKIERKIKRAQERIILAKKRHDEIEKGGGKLTVHAGWDLGYYEGHLASCENERDALEDILSKFN